MSQAKKLCLYILLGALIAPFIAGLLTLFQMIVSNYAIEGGFEKFQHNFFKNIGFFVMVSYLGIGLQAIFIFAVTGYLAIYKGQKHYIYLVGLIVFFNVLLPILGIKFHYLAPVLWLHIIQPALIGGLLTRHILRRLWE
jgi:hypothetical protein